MPVFLGLVYRKTPWWSGMACVIAAITTTFTLFFMDLFPDMVFVRNVVGTVVSSITVFVISAFFYRDDDPNSDEARKLDHDLRTPVEEDPNDVDPNAMQVYGMVGNVCWLLSVVLLGCTSLYWVGGSAASPEWWSDLRGRGQAWSSHAPTVGG